MQEGPLTASDVLAYTTRVLVNGIQRPIVSWSMDRELAGDLPDQVVAGSGITQATGTVEWAATADVSAGATNPWNKSAGWLPAKGDRVEIFAGDGVAEWKQFHGLINKTTGSIGDGFQSALIDDYDKLSATLSHVPLLRIMPPLVDGGAYRGIGLNSSYFADAAMRRAGFFVTPKTETNASLSVPCQGSMWPEVGTIATGGPSSGGGSHHALYPAPWGWAAGNFSNTYQPTLSRTASDPVQLTVMIGPDHTGFFYIRAVYGSSYAQLGIDGSGLVTARISGTTVAQFTMGGPGVVQLLVKAGTATLRASTGQVASGAATLAGSTVLGSFTVSGTEGTRVAGIQGSHPDTTAQEFASIGYVRSATMDFTDASLNGGMDGSRAIEDQRTDELLSDISQATLTAMWIDELGVMQWIPTMVLRKRPVARTVTTLNDIFSLDWEDSLLGARSKVTITALQPAISRGRTCSRLLWSGSGDELGSEEVSEEVIEPEANEDWIQPDGTMEIIGTGSWDRFNIRSGTIGGIFYTSSGEVVSEAGLHTSIAMGRLGINRYKIRHVAGVFPAGVSAVLGTSPTAASLWPRNRDKELPVVRGFGKLAWAEVRVSPVAAGGPGPELVHDAGIWNNQEASTEIIERFGTYLAGQTANPRPVITGLEVVYDPRTQLGDVIGVESDSLMGVRMTALIVGISNAGGSEYTQELSVRILSAASTFQTYAEFNDALPGTSLTYQQWQALGPVPETYTEFNAAA